MWIINATSKTLKLSNSRGHMNFWFVPWDRFPSQSLRKCYIEYTDSNPHKDVTAEVTFQVTGTSSSFKLTAHWPQHDHFGGLRVDWSNTDKNLYEIFPPTLYDQPVMGPDSWIGRLGWVDNGSVSLLILEKGIQTSIDTVLPIDDSIVQPTKPLPTLAHGNQKITSKWMEVYSGLLGKLTLTEMTLPGTHDSGTYQPASIPPFSSYVQTQEFSLAQQLDYGIRVLDLRIGQNKPGEYIICHDKYRTSYSLEQALKEVKDFIHSTTKEIVVLDFHRFVNFANITDENDKADEADDKASEIDDGFDYIQLKLQLAAELSGYCVPPNNVSGTLEIIWSAAKSSKDRVVVAWKENMKKPGSKPDDYMWPGVIQRWYEGVKSPKALHNAIEKDMLDIIPNHLPEGRMWAACSFMASGTLGRRSLPLPLATPYDNARELNPTLSNWYFGGSTLCDKANIISVDFFYEFSNIIQASIVANLLKAGRK